MLFFFRPFLLTIKVPCNLQGKCPQELSIHFWFYRKNGKVGEVLAGIFLLTDLKL
jgi:hypothetical protein